MISVGFTGTRSGMTPEQKVRVEEILRYKDFIGHHGLCRGADEEFHVIARNVVNGCRWMHLHPSTLVDERGTVEHRDIDITHSAKPPLDRNHDIVDVSDFLIAAPKDYEMRDRRSGTWATIRYARKLGKKIYILMPNGAMFMENC